MQFTDDEIETIKDIINEHGSDCPGTDSDKVKELKYKLGLSIRPTPKEIAEQEKRRKEFAESDLGKLIIAAFNKSNTFFLEQQKEWAKDNAFINGDQWNDKDFKIDLRIKLPNNYIVKNTKLSSWQRLRKYLNV